MIRVFFIIIIILAKGIVLKLKKKQENHRIEENSTVYLYVNFININ